MDFLTELFFRPRRKSDPRGRAVLAILNAMTNHERRDIRVPPPDFPRKPRIRAAW